MYILNRLPGVLASFFVMKEDNKATIGRHLEFIGVLSVYPIWAIAAAFDDWLATESKRPAPADIAKLARTHMVPINAEISRRTRVDDLVPLPSRTDEQRAKANDVMVHCGFAPAPLSEGQPRSLASEQAAGGRP